MRTVAPLVLGSLVLLAGCSASTPPEVETSQTVADSTTEEPAGGTDDAASTADTDGAADDASALPDPAALIGGELHTEFTAVGDTTIVDGVDVGVVTVFGACFGGTGEHVCDWSIQASALPASGGVPEPSTQSLLFLLHSNGAMADGTPLWSVVDAIVTAPPSGEPALLEYCSGAEGVAFYPEPGAPLAATIPAAAAWAANADKTALVSVDPAGLSCEAMGD